MTPDNNRGPERRMFLRRRFLVDPPMQWSMVGHSLLLSLLLLTVVLGGLWWPLFRGLADAGSNQVRDSDVATAMLYLHGNLWWIVLVCVVLPLLMSIRVSHRIAGPLVRVKRMFQGMGEGPLPEPIRTRRSDYLKPEVALLNAAVTQLAESMRQLNAHHVQLRQALQQARSHLGDAEMLGIAPQLDEALAAADAADAVVRRYLPGAPLQDPSAPEPALATVRSGV